jgi:hypothetical protein
MQCEQQPWPRLLALSCLSLAAKMQRVATFSIDHIQVLDFGAYCLRFGEWLLWILMPKFPMFFLLRLPCFAEGRGLHVRRGDRPSHGALGAGRA